MDPEFKEDEDVKEYVEGEIPPYYDDYLQQDED